MVQANDLMTPEMLARLREVANTLVDRAQARFRETVVPIYGSKENSRPVHIGSAVLLDLRGHKALLTAAHVIDESQSTTLDLGVGDGLEKLEGGLSVTAAPHGRARDHYDFAFHFLAEDLVAKVRRLVGMDEMSISARTERGRSYSALGYPNSKNRNYNPEKRSVKARLFTYSDIHKVDPEIAAKLPGDGDHHIFMTYAKRSRDDEGNVVNSTAPKGMSGGAVVDAGRPVDLNVFFGGEIPVPMLAGVVIELKRKRVLLGVRMEVILPELLAALPKV